MGFFEDLFSNPEVDESIYSENDNDEIIIQAKSQKASEEGAIPLKEYDDVSECCTLKPEDQFTLVIPNNEKMSFRDVLKKSRSLPATKLAGGGGSILIVDPLHILHKNNRACSVRRQRSDGVSSITSQSTDTSSSSLGFEESADESSTVSGSVLNLNSDTADEYDIHANVLGNYDEENAQSEISGSLFDSIERGLCYVGLLDNVSLPCSANNSVDTPEPVEPQQVKRTRRLFKKEAKTSKIDTEQEEDQQNKNIQQEELTEASWGDSFMILFPWCNNNSTTTPTEKEANSEILSRNISQTDTGHAVFGGAKKHHGKNHQNPINNSTDGNVNTVVENRNKNRTSALHPKASTIAQEESSGKERSHSSGYLQSFIGVTVKSETNDNQVARGSICKKVSAAKSNSKPRGKRKGKNEKEREYIDDKCSKNILKKHSKKFWNKSSRVSVDSDGSSDQNSKKTSPTTTTDASNFHTSSSSMLQYIIRE